MYIFLLLLVSSFDMLRNSGNRRKLWRVHGTKDSFMTALATNEREHKEEREWARSTGQTEYNPNATFETVSYCIFFFLLIFATIFFFIPDKKQRHTHTHMDGARSFHHIFLIFSISLRSPGFLWSKCNAVWCHDLSSFPPYTKCCISTNTELPSNGVFD